ncbi:NAD-dependent epimerase/dehydratase family protein [Rhodosalinus sediminis]|uniref:NAD-dependent epimerase/dehydratase family protein n=1 Tax=Rhodosalinus sediminis TaxID=1940533 RepID=UPI0023573912|nr:NAD-dependent epimerase/dehydratase family protein [Rhodosalinus sediminis]
MSAPRLLVVGGSGRVGRLLARAWAAAPPSLAPLWQSRRGGAGALRWAPLDAGAGGLTRQLDAAPAAMLVLAGVTPGPGAALEDNAALAAACLDAARAAGIPRVLYASSSAVYGAPGARPFREDDAPAPVSAYGAAKLAAEHACAAARGAGLEVCALRIGNVFGADALTTNAARLGPGEALAIDRFADGAGPERSYIGPATLARVLGALAADPAPLPETLNLAAPGRVAMADLATAAGLPWRWTPAPEGAVRRLLLDCSALAARVPVVAAEGTARGIAGELARLPPLPALDRVSGPSLPAGH